MNFFCKSMLLGTQFLMGLSAQATNFNLDQRGNLWIPNKDGCDFRYAWMVAKPYDQGNALCIRLYNYNNEGEEHSRDEFGFWKSKATIRNEIRSWLNEGKLDLSVEIPEWFQGKPLDQIVPFAQENQDKTLVLFFGDTHGCWKSYDRILWTIRKALEVHPQKVHVVVTGDLADRFGTWKKGEGNAPDRLGSDACIEFLCQIRQALKARSEDNSLFVVLGNHDTQNSEDFERFRERLVDEGLTPLCTNIPSAFEDSTGLCSGDTLGRVLFLPYGMNYANGGHCTDSPGFLSMFKPEAQRALKEFNVDLERTGKPDGIFVGRNASPVTPNPERELNPIAKETAELFITSVKKLAYDNPGDEPLHVVLMAHDHFLRPLVFFELVTQHCPTLRLPEATLKRLKIWEACGHEHFPYMVSLNGYMTSSEGNSVAIPCVAGGPSVFGEAMGLFALE